VLFSDYRVSIRQSSQRLVKFGRQQKSLQVAAESLRLGAGTEEPVEASGIVLKRSRNGAYRRAFGHGSATIRARPWPTLNKLPVTSHWLVRFSPLPPLARGYISDVLTVNLSQLGVRLCPSPSVRERKSPTNALLCLSLHLSVTSYPSVKMTTIQKVAGSSLARRT
jgi:hypothetical protein